MVVIMGMKVWKAGRVTVDTMVRIASEKFEKAGQNAIIAIEKPGDIVEMRKDVFTTNAELIKQVAEYQALGFKVHFVEV